MLYAYCRCGGSRVSDWFPTFRSGTCGGGAVVLGIVVLFRGLRVGCDGGERDFLGMLDLSFFASYCVD